MLIGGKEFQTAGRTYVMGILNVTPDSFSDGGRWNRLDEALFHAEAMARDGAALLDIGGESTRPGFTVVGEQQEMERVLPVIEAVRARVDVPLSIDTRHAGTAREAVRCGAAFVNDVDGLLGDPAMAGVVARAGVPCCLMHHRERTEGQVFRQWLTDSLEEMLAAARQAGIAEDRIVLDPGIGFCKTDRENLSLICHLDVLRETGFPILLGASRKSVIGRTLGLPVDERTEGTLATSVLAAEKGCMFVRVHDVKENVRAVRMTEAILEAGRSLPL